jgi:hypothetical protein
MMWRMGFFYSGPHAADSEIGAWNDELRIANCG